MGNSLELMSGSPQGSSSTTVGPSSTNPIQSTEDITAISTRKSYMQEQMQTQLQI
ncbi:hypothetical protein GYH30_031014 [Glycine max]|nr:hypothetical protein GYH30_031014 [Glycine max]